ERDDEVRHRAEPFGDLLLDAGLCPLPHCALRCTRLALAYDALALAGVLDRCPEITDMGVGQMSLLWVCDRRRFIQKGSLYPLRHIERGGEWRSFHPEH